MREGGIAAQELALMHAHDAAPEGVVHAVLNLVKPVQQRRFPALWNHGGGIAPLGRRSQRSF
jgi:hypothetical protein